MPIEAHEIKVKAGLPTFKKPKDLTVEYEGALYFTVNNFALVTKRSSVNVRFLIVRGNRIRKLKAIYVLDRPLIPYSELAEYPFTCAGKKNKDIYHYTEMGQQVTAPKAEIEKHAPLTNQEMEDAVNE
jgi:hypothetical protein